MSKLSDPANRTPAEARAYRSGAAARRRGDARSTNPHHCATRAAADKYWAWFRGYDHDGDPDAPRKRQPAPPKWAVVYDRLGPNRMEVKADRPLCFCLGDQVIEIKITDDGFQIRAPDGGLVITPDSANVVYITNPKFNP